MLVQWLEATFTTMSSHLIRPTSLNEPKPIAAAAAAATLLLLPSTEPMLIQWLEAMDTTTMCMLMGVCAVLGTPQPGPHFAPHFAPHHAAALETPVAAAAPVPMCLAGPLAALGAAVEAQEGPSNDACDICKVRKWALFLLFLCLIALFVSKHGRRCMQCCFKQVDLFISTCPFLKLYVAHL